MKGHVIVGGFTTVGAAAVRELLASGREVVVIAENAKEEEAARGAVRPERTPVVRGDLTSPETLERAEVGKAASLILCHSEDTVNLIAALFTRNVHPTVRVVVSLHRPELRKTLKAAGVTFIVSTKDMGGRMCASAAFRPEVVQTLEDLTTAAYGADVQEYRVLEGAPIAGLPLLEAERRVRQASDCLVLGIVRGPGPAGKEEYRTVINPPSSTRFDVGTAVLVIGSLANLKRFAQWYGLPQGR
ncbi:MAG: TrkA family potassium uptake protein [Euryarchaeota archaeon]|nr:TrkA family potassium uptake protein [Euryarchaeota archaeon]MDE1835018.1 TrkA family potassium uptake protein [Euryarchaeota archaeon]MDE1881339.1 TrkA family potassium uptake protein [Euryarchaeota archaeon]MDE2044857.1 TrkA family potassium uptake protein [Thermoplasmata archaeon]